MLVNIDFRQIEIVVLAYLSQDQKLIKLIQDGRDLYKYFAAIMYDKPEELVTKEERDTLKAPVLGISYGRGAKALSEESGKPVEWCQEFIDRFYQEFPRVRDLHQSWIQEVNRTGCLKMFHNVMFKFNKYIWNNQTKKKELSNHFRAKYWEPQIKNYPVQHTAFLLLSTFVAEFYRQKAVYKRDKYLMVSTVHDSLVLDCRPEYIEEAQEDVKIILAKLPEICYNKYEMKIDMPINVDITTGYSWYDC